MSAQTDQTTASLGRRKEGVRRASDLQGWARVLGEGLTLAAER